ncbi:inner centromere protein isoform X1 [Podarcis raffonei]|uniref:inner centromere protein isoform X1 n=1 Tax=Podarcis raffonei TaxID=65483 RepID=UPI0023297FFC|nr:inner centromere protein isoform X1 [Podarcis raffonei]
MWKMGNPVMPEERARKKLAEFLQNIDNNDCVWMDEIIEEAKKMFMSGSSDEPELMPKTPSQKSHRKKKRFSSVKNDHFATKRLSRRESTRLFSKRITRSRKNLEINVENASPCHRVTRSRAASSASVSDAPLKKLSFNLAKDRLPLVVISANERRSAELQAKKVVPQTDTADLTLKLSEEGSPIKRSPLTKTCLVAKETPEAEIKEGRGICKMKIAEVPGAAENKESSTQNQEPSAQNQEDSWASESEAAQKLNQSSQAPTTSKANCRSVRLSRTSKSSRASMAERYSLSTKRERMIRRSSRKSLSKRKTSQQSLSARHESCHVAVAEEITESGLMIEPPSQKVDENPRMSLRSHKASMQAVIKPVEQDGDDKGGNSERTDEVQKQPQSARRKPSYKRAVYEQDEGQHSEEDFSPARKRAVSPQCPASKVVRPFKTFLHTVHKNRVLMMTPGSLSRSATMKSFIKQNTPIQATPQRGFVQKERERLESQRKREEAEQLRRQKLEEGKKQRLEEIKRKREDRLRKVLQARERVEQMEEEKRRRLEQKLAQHEEKNEKVREEKLAEDKVKKKVAAKKLEELEARRKQEEDARKKRALQLEEERRHKEQMQKKREEEEQEKARKIAEQHQLELEREKKLFAERELEKRREQERLQAQREHEQKEKEKAAQLHKEVLAAAKEKERLRKELEEKERKLQEQRQQEEKREKAASEAEAKASSKQLNTTVVIENSTSCNSYPMTPQGPKQPKIDVNNYGMDLNSDDSTDDESQPRKPIPAWATGNLLSQAIIHQYYKPVDTTALFGVVKSPKLEEIFKKSKPRYFKRTSSAVWNSPPFPGGRNVPYALKI